MATNAPFINVRERVLDHALELEQMARSEADDRARALYMAAYRLLILVSDMEKRMERLEALAH